MTVETEDRFAFEICFDLSTLARPRATGRGGIIASFVVVVSSHLSYVFLECIVLCFLVSVRL